MSSTITGRSFLDLLSPADRARLIEWCEPANFTFGQIIVRQDESVDAMYVLVSGRARVVQIRPNGEEIVLSTLEAGDVFGEIALLHGGRRSATVRASSDVTALRLDEQRFAALLEEQPELQQWLEHCGRARLLFKFLRRVQPFAELPVAVLRDMLEALQPMQAQRGETIIRQGDPPGAMYLVEEGRLRVTRYDNGQVKDLAFLRSGDVFGEVSLLNDEPRSAAVDAVTDVKLYSLEADAMQQLMSRWPQLRHAMHQRAATYDFEREARLPLDFAVDTEPADTHRPAQVAEEVETTPSQLGERSKKKKTGWRFPFVYQVDEMDCGVAALAMICRHFGRRVSLSRIRELAHTATDGTTLRNLCRAADQLGLAARAIKISMRHLDEMPTPAIVHWENYHWVVVVEVRRDRVRVADPAIGDQWLPREEFESKWNGYAGLFDYTQAFEKAPQTTRSLSWLLPHAKPYAGVLARAFLLALIAGGLMLVLPVFTQFIVDTVIADAAVDILNMVLVAMAVTFVFHLASTILQGYLLAFVAVRVDASAFDFITRRLLALPMRYFHGRRTGDIQRRLDGARQIREMLVTSGISGVVAVVQFSLAVILMLVYSAKLTTVYLFVAPLYAALMVCSARFLRPLFDRLEASYGKYRSEQIDAIKGIEAVKSAGAEPNFREHLLGRFLSTARQQFRADLTVLVYQGAVQAVGFLTSLLFLWLGARLAIEGKLTLGGFVAFNALVAMANMPIVTVLSLWDDWQLVRVLLNRLSDVFEHTPEQGEDHSHLRPVKTISGQIDLRGVGFRYGGTDATPILQDISLEIPAGKMIAIVGPSGAGKTTLVKLVGGLIEPTEGAILFDGIDQSRLDYRELRQHIGFVLQDNHIFSGSIMANIAFGDEPDADRALVAARISHCHEFIERLPLGYETQVGETGVTLSGGQRQRLTIARALYRNPAVLIFDEATSALDAESERVIYQNLESIIAGRTVFVVAHRLSTIRRADHIVVLDRGCVAEQGTHDDLMDRGGIYFYLVSRQVEL